MEVFIIFLLSVTIIFLAKSNYFMSKELKLGDSKAIRDLKEFEDIKKKMRRGEILPLAAFDDYITQITEKHSVECKQLKDRMSDIIIKADEIAGTRAQSLLDRWKLEEEKNIRSDAIKRSQNVIKGKVTEHIVPYLPQFRWDPRDARFIGTPLDYIVFEGLSAGNVEKVIFVEVKAGKKGNLSTRERQCRDAIIEGKVTYEKIHVTD